MGVASRGRRLARILSSYLHGRPGSGKGVLLLHVRGDEQTFVIQVGAERPRRCGR